MSTNSAIGMKMDDGTVRAVYCHWDGYLAGVGRTLADNYRDPTKVAVLIALGNLSSLGANVAPAPGMEHSWQHPQPDVTVAYHRDRKERLRRAEVFASVEAYGNEAGERFGCPVTYLFEAEGEQGSWRVLDDGKWKDVAELLESRVRGK